MSSLSLSYIEDDSAPSIYSVGPREEKEDGERSAAIIFQPWGDPQSFSATMYFTIDEAEKTARRLLEFVLAAREGVYSGFLEDLPEYRMKFALDQAWRSLGLSPGQTKPAQER